MNNPKEEEYEYDGNMQGFPGQVYSKKLTEKEKNLVSLGTVATFVFWIVAIIVILSL